MDDRQIDFLAGDIMTCRGMMMSLMDVIERTKNEDAKTALYAALNGLTTASAIMLSELPVEQRKKIGAWWNG